MLCQDPKSYPRLSPTKTAEMSGKSCAVCGKILDDTEIRINERKLGSRRTNPRYLCRECRKKEYNNYTESIQRLIDKKL